MTRDQLFREHLRTVDLIPMLLPCPFCGGKDPAIYEINPDPTGGREVQCNCGAIVYSDTTEGAITLWNTRA